MSYVLKNNGEQIAISAGWNPRLFSKHTGASFPEDVPGGWSWLNGDWSLVWEDDPAPPPPTTIELLAQLIAAVQDHLDTAAQSKGYDNIVSACSYAAAPNPFQAESVAFITWRGNVWATCYMIIGEVQTGSRIIPTAEELIAELPIIEAKV